MFHLPSAESQSSSNRNKQPFQPQPPEYRECCASQMGLAATHSQMLEPGMFSDVPELDMLQEMSFQ